MTIVQHALAGDVSFDFIRYGNCWEDADILCEALQPCAGKRVLSIASAGDNSLALVAEGAEVVAADLSIPQLACLELRCLGFRQLDHSELLSFLGVTASQNRRVIFNNLSGGLSPLAREFWQRHSTWIDRGIIHAGKLESYFRLFRRWCLPLIHSRRTRERLLVEKDGKSQADFWSTWDNRRWRWLFRLFFSRRLMGRFGRDPRFFRHVQGDVSQQFMRRAKYGLTQLPTHANPFLNYIVCGNFGDSLPRYLRKENFGKVRDGLRRLTMHHGSIEEVGQKYCGDGFDAFNLSDIFEYLSSDEAGRLYLKLVDVANSGARLAYWNTLVPRGRPDSLVERVDTLGELSRELFKRDLAFFYGEFHVDQVRDDHLPSRTVVG